jgi:hypothetical protein
MQGAWRRTVHASELPPEPVISQLLRMLASHADFTRLLLVVPSALVWFAQSACAFPGSLEVPFGEVGFQNTSRSLMELAKRVNREFSKPTRCLFRSQRFTSLPAATAQGKRLSPSNSFLTK